MRKLFLLFALLPCCASERSAPVEEFLKFQSGEVVLEGTLNLPDNEGKFPVAVFIHGSGLRTRDDYRAFVKSFNDIGVATFRYDKRGVGASGGKYIDVGTVNSERAFAILAGDAIAAIEQLKKESRIDSQKIILVGASQAGWIIPEVNTRTNIYLSVCISGPLVSVGEEIYYSNLAEHGARTQEEADSLLQFFDGEKGFDPLSRITIMRRPSLWLFGGKDVSIPIKRSLELFDSLQIKANPYLEMKFFPEADHGLYNHSTHRREDYIADIVDWIKTKL